MKHVPGPLARAPADVLDDVLDGLISRDAAAADYGVSITDGGTLDLAATEGLRDAARRGAGGR